MDNSGSLIALTGGSGFLGSHIADALLARGHRVRVAVRPTSDRRWLGDERLQIVTADLKDPGDCSALLDGAAGIVHCAGVVSAPDEAAYHQGNVAPTKALLAAAAARWGDDPGCVFVLVSSLAAHGPAPLARPAREDDPSRPLTAYGRSKRQAELAVLEAPGAFRRVILRPPSLYGPRDREFLPLLRAATRGLTVRLGRRMTGLSLVDGRDAATAAVALLDNPSAAGIYFVSDDRGGYDWDDLRIALAAAAGRRVRRITVPLNALRAASGAMKIFSDSPPLLLNADRLRDLDTAGWVCDGSRLARDTGFAANWDAAEGFADALAFYRENNWL